MVKLSFLGVGEVEALYIASVLQSRGGFSSFAKSERVRLHLLLEDVDLHRFDEQQRELRKFLWET